MAQLANLSSKFQQVNIKLPAWTDHFRKRVYYHILFWLILFLYNTIYIGFLIKDYRYAFFDFTVKLPFIIAICYFNNYYLIPAFLYLKKYAVYILSIFFTLLTLTILLQISLNSLVYINLCPRQYLDDALFSYDNTLDKMFSMSTIVFFTTGLKLSKDWLAQQQQITEIGNRQLKTELDFLKLQINPHFFFNTLNNLYALVLKKSDRAPEVVLKFSEMVSYLLYESNHPKALLTTEIDVLQNYLGLEQLRFGDRVELNFRVTGDTRHFHIPPLILLPFIENCFKHGTRNLLQKVEISIAITIANDSLLLQTINPLPLKTQEPDKNGGVGLTNAKRRLDLIYGTAYNLQAGEQDGQFIVSLKVQSL